MKRPELLQSGSLLLLESYLQKRESILIEGLWNSPKALIAALAQQITGKHILILTGASHEEVQLYHDFHYFTDRPVVDYPAWETLPNENIPPSPDIVGERYKVLEGIVKEKQPRIILSGLQACLQKLLPPHEFQEKSLYLKKGSIFPFDKLIHKLVEMGYTRGSIAADKGEFAVRGGIIDIFPISSPDPFRLEFWDEEIESIRIYDPIGQKSVKPADEVLILPAKELEFVSKKESLGTVLDYLGKDTLIIFDDLLSLEDRYASLVNLGGKFNPAFSSIEDFLTAVSPLQKIFLSQQPIEDLSEVQVFPKPSENFLIRSLQFELFHRKFKAEQWTHPFIPIAQYLLPDVDSGTVTGEEILQALNRLSTSEAHLHLLCATELEETTFQKRILDAGIRLPKHTTFHIDYLSSGFALKDMPLVVFPMTEITHRFKIRRQKQRSTYHTDPVETYSLMPGELVVHFNHGIGRYMGLEKKPNHLGRFSEFFVIEYAEQSKLYVPFNQAHLITKYIGSTEETPKLHAIGSTRWKRAKEHAERSILNYASDLLDLYARRKIEKGYHFEPDSHDLKAFEEDFPFIETEDQLASIHQIKLDMMSDKSMDRLVCGDVGYGKTEVAMRAAFKAVVDGGKQVAVLVPTTVLAMQHFENFSERMNSFPINIGVLSRFRTPSQTKETLKGLESGAVDIVIGTHRIISEDVVFKNLGLIIIDEEQRFGVKAKEHLKKIKIGVDCLTLSATPIPRTLYMSLTGARDMSIINTPPQDRLPIKTVLVEKHDQMIKNALQRELARDGQSYIIHNRVETIYSFADHIKKLIPNARVGIAHGQMAAHEIDSIFHSFRYGNLDILVATTIVENGIDIPNANTILIDRADQFGMADLYQLRGRVGRWNRTAYAYFMVPNLKTLPELSRKRLQALIEASSGYGGGMRVAMRDLEIRGAGNILGMEQSGHVSAIGFHLYCKLLKRTVQTLQGKIPSVLMETKLELPFDGYLPEEYVNDVDLRRELYQRLGDTIKLEEVEDIFKEIKDRFGPLPEPAVWLYHMCRIRLSAATHGFTLVKLEKMTLHLEKKIKKKIETKKILFKPIKDPGELEQKLLKELQNFTV